MPAIIDVRFSLGALLIGCFIAVACVHPHFPCAIADPVPYLLLRLSGVVAFQACLYFRLYQTDKPLNKLMVRRSQLLCTNCYTNHFTSVGCRGLVGSGTCVPSRFAC